jgi:hypothetical protein
MRSDEIEAIVWRLGVDLRLKLEGLPAESDPADFLNKFPDPGENYQGLTIRHALPGRPTPSFDTSDAAAVLWYGDESASYSFYYKYWLLRLKDGRYAFASSKSDGTCSYCGGSSDDVAIADRIEDVIIYGMGDHERDLLGI